MILRGEYNQVRVSFCKLVSEEQLSLEEMLQFSLEMYKEDK